MPRAPPRSWWPPAVRLCFGPHRAVGTEADGVGSACAFASARAGLPVYSRTLPREARLGRRLPPGGDRRLDLVASAAASRRSGMSIPSDGDIVSRNAWFIPGWASCPYTAKVCWTRTRRRHCSSSPPRPAPAVRVTRSCNFSRSLASRTSTPEMKRLPTRIHRPMAVAKGNRVRPGAEQRRPKHTATKTGRPGMRQEQATSRPTCHPAQHTGPDHIPMVSLRSRL